MKIERDLPYENTSGPLAEYADAVTVVGTIISVAGVGALLVSGPAAAVLGTATTCGGVGTSIAGVVGIFQRDDIPDMAKGVTKYEVISRYYYIDPLTNETICAPSKNIYYYVPQTGTMYDGNRKSRIYPTKAGVRNEKN